MAARQSPHLCQRFQAAADLLGKRWTALIVQVLEEGPFRFSEIAERIEVLSDRMLSERLKELDEAGVVERKVLPDPPVRVEYRLTRKGVALAGVVRGLSRWADDWVELEAVARRKGA